QVLRIFGKETDDEGYIVERNSGERVLTPEGEPIKRDNLGMIARGSEVFVEDNFVSKLNYVKNR
ncbi:MAG: hypothetical protein ABEJ91_00290, partial [Candidatus Nanohaloarchaea archaeon]